MLDYAILGGGCAGLAMGRELSAAQPSAAIAILEPRTVYRDDRTWCFWPCGIVGPIRELVSHSWPRVAVRSGGERVVAEADGLPYCYVRGEDYYQWHFAHFRQRPNIDLRLGETARGVRRGDKGFIIETDVGDRRARHVLDSRHSSGADDPSPRPKLLQHFLGQRIRASRSVFDSQCVTLMDFDVDQSRGLCFVYVLPFGSHEALVEATWISRSPLEADVYRQAIADFLGERHGIGSFEVVAEERGAIPMDAGRRPATDEGVVPIGTVGGAVKPSSGYAFLAIQRQAASVASVLAAGGRPEAGAPRSRLAQSLDAIFLSFLSEKPQAAPEVFKRLFERTSSRKLVRFLSDQAGGSDYLSVMLAMPWLTFMGQAWAARADWMVRS